MIEKILAALKESGVEQYQITESREESAELFFIRRSLDMRRIKEIRQAEVVVYKEFWEGENHLMGSASVQVQESFSQEEMAGLFRDALYAAGFVKNKFYELYPGQTQEARAVSDGFGGRSLTEIAGEFSGAMFAEDREEEVFLNSAEIFATKVTRRILNSRGVDVGYEKNRVEGEFVVQCTAGQDVETYQDFAYDGMNTDALRQKVRHGNDPCPGGSAVRASCGGIQGDIVRPLCENYSGLLCGAFRILYDLSGVFLLPAGL